MRLIFNISVLCFQMYGTINFRAKSGVDLCKIYSKLFCFFFLIFFFFFFFFFSFCVCVCVCLWGVFFVVFFFLCVFFFFFFLSFY